MPPDSTPPVEVVVVKERSGFLHRIPRRTQYLLGGLVVVSILAGAYFVGSDAYYQVEPLEVDTVSVPSVTEEWKGDDPEIVAAFMSALSTSVQRDCDRFVHGYQFPGESGNEIFSTSESIALASCELMQGRNGSILQHPLYVSGEVDYGVHGLGVLVMGKQIVLVSYELQAKSIDAIQFVMLNDVKSVSSLSLAADNRDVLIIKGVDNTGSTFERFISFTRHGRYGTYFANPVIRNKDGSFTEKITGAPDSRNVGFSFLSPFTSIGYWGSWSDRATALEDTVKTTPIYFASSCGVEPQYADMQYSERIDQGTEMIVALHTHTGPLLYTTSAQVGYSPEDWDKVVKTITPEELRAQIATNAVEYQKPVERLAVAGQSVKHTGPFGYARGCGYSGSQIHEYQTNKDGVTVTISFKVFESQQELSAVTEENRRALVERVLSTLTVTPAIR